MAGGGQFCVSVPRCPVWGGHNTGSAIYPWGTRETTGDTTIEGGFVVRTEEIGGGVAHRNLRRGDLVVRKEGPHWWEGCLKRFCRLEKWKTRTEGTVSCHLFKAVESLGEGNHANGVHKRVCAVPAGELSDVVYGYREGV